MNRCDRHLSLLARHLSMIGPDGIHDDFPGNWIFPGILFDDGERFAGVDCLTFGDPDFDEPAVSG
jgi:hypothetical protein